MRKILVFTSAKLEKEIALPKIIDSFSEVSGLSKDQLKGESRFPEISQTRQEAYLMARIMTNYSLPQIGEAFNRDHTTIMHGISEASKRLWADLGKVKRNLEAMGLSEKYSKEATSQSRTMLLDVGRQTGMAEAETKTADNFAIFVWNRVRKHVEVKAYTDAPVSIRSVRVFIAENALNLKHSH